ncbi:592_t:CDS:1, partial [Funneliformis geosporum]
LTNNRPLEIALKVITDSSKNEVSQRPKRYDLLVKSLEKLNEKQLIIFFKLRYPKGQNQVQIISTFYKKKQWILLIILFTKQDKVQAH